jgi:hypothetical protein
MSARATITTLCSPVQKPFEGRLNQEHNGVTKENQTVSIASDASTRQRTQEEYPGRVAKKT